MSTLSKRLEITRLPAYIESWSVARIPGFVLAVLQRWQRNHGELPSRFAIVMCPQAELNARGGLPARVIELTDAKLRCAHFTGCHKPYFVVIFTGADAKTRCMDVLKLLAWSEAYVVDLREDLCRLEFVGSTEDLDDNRASPTTIGKLQKLLKNGELVGILG